MNKKQLKSLSMKRVFILLKSILHWKVYVKVSHLNTFLFLDDIRIPKEAYSYTGNRLFISKKWVVVRNYDEFVKYITQKGMPGYISFDHDLADSHYTPSEYWDNYEESKKWQEAQVHTEKTGFDCAKWLVNYCMDNNLQLPEFYCHSMNPVGKDNILGLLNPFKVFQNK